LGRSRKPRGALAKRLEQAKARLEKGKLALEHETKMVLVRIKANLEADQKLVAQLEEAIATQKDAGSISSSKREARAKLASTRRPR
jgi:hypothetical protein